MRIDQSKCFSSRNKPKKCPFYKWIPDTSITVDAFRYGDIPGCTCYFLSHFHSDHFRGIHKNFKGRIYCSEVTKNLLKDTYGPNLVISVLEIEKCTKICDVEVTAFDANHCPGSLMFLFHLPSKQKTYLHTGDFRYTPEMLILPSSLTNYLTNDCLKDMSSRIDSVFLDTTYCFSQYDFPTQEKVIEGAVKITAEYLTKDRTTLIICGMYSIGKERFVYGIASELNLQVWLPKYQSRLVKLAAQGGCDVCKKLLQCVTNNPQKAQLHVLPMQQLNLKSLIKHRNEMGSPLPADPFQKSSCKSNSRPVLGWRPTGWSHRKLNRSQTSLIPLPEGVVLEGRQENIHIYGAPYSEHSSFLELKEFITRLRPSRVVPTVLGKSAASVKDTVNSWLT
uniref:DNA repair metallo-beta-lactamase domain-containing protein n=2 Tax=Trichobilharzia regenti TaxID=157069 RepID=A0AA85KK92_TRIRE|nr:unnamed protein product [Trichobilharzia regenti]